MASAKERLRREKVRILLRTRNDAYPTVRARAIPSTPSGPAPGRSRKCPACDGQGKVRLRNVCSICEGRGRISVDAYVGQVSDANTRRTGGMPSERIDAEIARLDTSLKLSEGKIDPNEAYGWERARQAQLVSGSYAELERVLQWLREKHTIGWDFLMWVYGPLEPALSKTHSEMEDYIVAEVARRMPSNIKVPKREWEALREKRRSRVKQLAGEATPQEIADEVGLSLRTVMQMLTDLRAA